jgi:hypothetical protein
MEDPKQRTNFWLGNGLLAAALLSLFFLGPLSELLGAGAMMIWMGLAGVGMYFIMKDKGPQSGGPD